MSTSEWQAARGELDNEERELRAALAAVPAPSTRPDIAVVRELWDDPDGMTLDEKREFLRLFIDVVWIDRGRRGSQGFQSDRVDIVWKTT